VHLCVSFIARAHALRARSLGPPIPVPARRTHQFPCTCCFRHTGKKKKGGAGAAAAAPPPPPELAAIGVAVGPEPLTPGPVALAPEPSLVFADHWPEAFDLVSGPEAALAVVDALVARLRFKRTYYLGLLHLVRHRGLAYRRIGVACLGWRVFEVVRGERRVRKVSACVVFW
jgi:hypothetical protein